MATLLATNAIPVSQISIAAASIGASYTLVGTFSDPLELATIVSTLDQPVQISFDGINDHQAVPVGDTVPSIIPLNFKSNRMVLPVVAVYAKQIGTPTTGNLYISGFTAQIP